MIGLAVLSALTPGCAETFDTTRTLPKRASVGQEMYGVLCDRVAAQALREDLSGASFRNLCHQPFNGEFATKVDTDLLPPLTKEAKNTKGAPVSVEKQRADRDRAVGRIEAMARRRDDLIRALDATFPEDATVAIRDLDNADPRKSCDAPKKSAEGLLTDHLADMLGRMGNLYTDGTLPQSTESLARVVEVFKADVNAQQAWQRISAREGYRPIDTALGAARPVIAYPNLRDFSNASLRLLSADSIPYEPNPQKDAQGKRIPVAGIANAVFNKMLEVGHEELLAVTPDPKLPPLVESVDATGRVVISRPRDNIELMQRVLYTEADAFSVGKPHYIVRRDARGYAKLAGGQLPAPFIDADKDGLPDLDDVGHFKTANGTIVPSPFSFPNGPKVARDGFDRVTVGNGLLYDYIDTSRTFAAQMMKDVKPLVNPDPAAKHETLMDLMGGMPIMMGPRETRTKEYGAKKLQYNGVRTKDSPMLDVVWALGAILGDQTADLTLSMSRELFTTKQQEMARVTGAVSDAYDIAQKHDEASIPRTSTFWDENIEIMAKMVKVDGLIEQVLRAFADPQTQQLGVVMAKFARFKDEMSYDRNNINGPTYNFTTKSVSEPKTPVDRAQPVTGKNRSALTRFLQVVIDTDGVAACNQKDARLNIDVPIAGSVKLPFLKFKECEVFKIDNLAAFYLDSVGDAYHNAPEQKPRRPGADPAPRPGTIYMRAGLLGAVSSGDLIEKSSRILGMYDTGGGFGSAIAPTPQYLNRLVFFDQTNDTKNTDSKNFVSDLQGKYMGTNLCPERVIDDPVPDAIDAYPDGKIRGLRNCPDGQWLQQRDPDALFPLESFGFYEAIKPLVSAFVSKGREDLFIQLNSAIYKHYPGKDASADECKLQGGKECPRDGMNSYEGIIAEAFGGDLVPAVSELVKALDTMAIKSCKTPVDARTGKCPEAQVELLSGIQVAAAATRAALDPDHAKAIKLTDRNGQVTTKRNDGSIIPQVTPAYLLTNALLGIDLAFDKYEEQNPNDKERRIGWRRARSQLVDQFLGTTGIKSNAAFSNPTIPTMTPVIVDMVRAQLWAHCPKSFAAPLNDGVAHAPCTWARQELAKKAEETLAGPLATTGIDMMDAMRRDPEGRREAERMMQYLVDTASQNDALANVLASSNDVLQLLRDDENLIPLLKVVAAAVDGSKYDDKGKLTEKSLVDAQMALLARVSGKYFDEEGKEICRNEVDPNQVLAVVLGKLVTPIKDGKFAGQSPVEVLIDVIADVNRDDPTLPYDGTLKQNDYTTVSAQVVGFLTDPQDGLEQFYEVIRQGLK